ncbi:hypothetical protein, partial [Escherichia coli]
EGKAERLTWHKAWTAVSSGFSISYTSRIAPHVARMNGIVKTGIPRRAFVNKGVSRTIAIFPMIKKTSQTLWMV